MTTTTIPTTRDDDVCSRLFHKLPTNRSIMSNLPNDCSTVPNKSPMRLLNKFETLFAENNVRFALLVELGHQDDTSEATKFNPTGLSHFTVPFWTDRVEQTLLHCRLGHLRVRRINNNNNNNDDDQKQIDNCEWYLETRAPGSSSPVHDTIGTAHEWKDIPTNMGQLLEDIVLQDDPPMTADGPLRIRFLTHGNQQDGPTVVGIVINGNHAMVDGKSLTGFVTKLVGTSPLDSTDSLIPLESRSFQMLPDWKDLVMDSLVKMGVDDGLAYLPPTHPVLTLNELQEDDDDDNNNNDGTNNNDFRDMIPAGTIAAVKSIVSQYKGCTMSGFLITILMASIATEYQHSRHHHHKNTDTGIHEKDIGVSVLVDLRQFLSNPSNDPNLPGDNADMDMNQAIGTVTVYHSALDILSKWTTRNSRFGVVAAVTEQLRTRIGRGEAHRSAVALCSGDFANAASGPATIEWSNIGVCQLPKGTTMHTCQRFDGYDGVSCLLHGETSTGVLRWVTSMGAESGVSAVRMGHIMKRVVGWMEEMG